VENARHEFASTFSDLARGRRNSWDGVRGWKARISAGPMVFGMARALHLAS